MSGEIADGEAVKEKPFEMSQSLKKNSKLDIHVEMNLLEKKLDELRAKNASEITIKYAMKDYGLERLLNSYFVVSYILNYSYIQYPLI